MTLTGALSSTSCRRCRRHHLRRYCRHIYLLQTNICVPVRAAGCTDCFYSIYLVFFLVMRRYEKIIIFFKPSMPSQFPLQQLKSSVMSSKLLSFGSRWNVRKGNSRIQELRRDRRCHGLLVRSTSQTQTLKPQSDFVSLYFCLFLPRAGSPLNTCASGSPGLWCCWSSLRASSPTSPSSWSVVCDVQPIHASSRKLFPLSV